MMNFDDVTKGNMKEHNPNWPIPDHPYRILIIGALDLEKKKFIIQSNRSSNRH